MEGISGNYISVLGKSKIVLMGIISSFFLRPINSKVSDS